VSRRQPGRVVGSRRDEIVEFASDTDVKVSVTVSADKYVWYSQPASSGAPRKNAQNFERFLADHRRGPNRHIWRCS
jgi:hypothetical protein